MVQAGEVVTDYDKLIDRQMERAGISAITTSRMILAVDCEVCTCGAGATTSLFAIISFCFSIYFFGAAARARIMPMTVCFPRRTQSSSGR